VLPPARHWQPCLTKFVAHDEVRRHLGNTGGKIEVEAEYRIATGRRWAATHLPDMAQGEVINGIELRSHDEAGIEIPCFA
jgi:alpha-D-ribose 1-methylphosphonate 5-triphosphate diphosphatase PhnM